MAGILARSTRISFLDLTQIAEHCRPREIFHPIVQVEPMEAPLLDGVKDSRDPKRNLARVEDY